GACFQVTTNARGLPLEHLQQYQKAQRVGLAIAKGKIFLGTWKQGEDHHVALPPARRKVEQQVIRDSILRGLDRLYEEGFKEGEFQIDLEGVALELGVKHELVTRAVDFLFDRGLIDDPRTMGRHREEGYMWLTTEGADYVESTPAKQSQATETTMASNEKFFPAGKVHDAYKEIRDLIAVAKKEIWIEDNWVNKTLFELLTNVGQNVEMKVLTVNFPGDFKLELQKFRQQHGSKIEVRTSATFHDRFIWIDGECYHLGASIKDAGTKSFMMSRLEDQTNVEAVWNNLRNDWQKGTPI
ncbi:MAG: hypothetical protein IIA91_05825, partial [Chloroflexi bacterium]|nr:hypothetical protein [Chloroflexota bacterium]